MPKVITISVYVIEKLSKLKGNKSFSQVIDELIKYCDKNSEGRVEALDLIFEILSEEEARELGKGVEEFRKNFKVREQSFANIHVNSLQDLLWDNNG